MPTLMEAELMLDDRASAELAVAELNRRGYAAEILDYRVAVRGVPDGFDAEMERVATQFGGVIRETRLQISR